MARRWLLPLLLALGAHSALLTIRLSTEHAMPSEQAIEVEMLAEPKAPEAEPEPKAPEPEPEVAKAPVAVAPTPSSPVAVADNSGPVGTDEGEGPAAEELAAPILTGGDDGGGSWDLLSGQGTALGRGGLGRPGRGGTGVARATSLSARDLSRDPIAPNLEPLVEKNFPTAARMAQVGGTVTVSAIIQPDGTPTDIRVVNVDPRGRGFGETCSRTVHEGPDWQPKLNRDGRPVPAKVTYTCKFKPPEVTLSDPVGPTTGSGANRVWTKPAGK